MRKLTRLPTRIPADAKYVLESHGAYVRRYLEFADGRILELSQRKAATCRCGEQATLAPEIEAAESEPLVAA